MNLSEVAKTLSLQRYGDDIFFNGCSIDSRTVKRGELFIAIHGEKFDGHDFLKQAAQSGAAAILVDHGSTDILPTLVCENTRYTMGELSSIWRARFTIPLIAITGSNGKTTVKEMLTAILSQNAPVNYTRGNLNNDLGVPLTLFGLGEEHRYAVIEMGANHPGEIARLCEIAKPTVAIITQCAPAHLEGFGSVEGVARAKAEIYEGLQHEGIAIINADDDYAGFWQEKTSNKKQMTFGLKNIADVMATRIGIKEGNSFLLKTADSSIKINLPLLGEHNVANATAAATCAIALNISLEQIKAGLESVTPVKGRMQMKKGIRKSRIIDDTYNANPTSLNAGINVLTGFGGQQWLVLGDMGELGSEQVKFHAEVGAQAKSTGIQRLFALGELVKHTVKSFGNGAEYFSTRDDLIARLQELVSADVTLLVKGSRSMHMEEIVQSLEDTTEC